MKSALILSLVVALAALQVSAYKALEEGNLKCTEFKGALDAQLVMHVPCLFIRLMERLKQCSFNTIQESFLDVGAQISVQFKKEIQSKATKLKKKVLEKTNLNSDTKDQVQNTADKLLDFLKRTPANLSTTFGTPELDCKLFASAMRLHLETKQGRVNLRHIFKDQKIDTDPLTTAVDPAAVRLKINEMKCDVRLSTDESSYYYLKYLVSSLLELGKASGNEKVTETDLAVLFVPYVEMRSRFERVLPSQSILQSILQNSEGLFANDACELAGDLGKEKGGKKGFLKRVG